MTDSAVYHRNAWGGGWTDWVRLDNFGCSTPDALASLLGGNVNPLFQKSFGFNVHKYKFAHIGRYQTMTIFLRYGNCTSSVQIMAIFSINNRETVTYTQTLAKAASPKIYTRTVLGEYTDVYVDAGETYPMVEVSSLVPCSELTRVCLEDATNVDFSQLQEVSL